tara:strand:- start:44436 stop:44867 length:432 start_codon:yes stop_codon:yes gene_type:complete
MLRKQRGFNIIEVMVAIFIISVSYVAFMSLRIYVMKSAELVEQKHHALLYAADKLDEYIIMSAEPTQYGNIVDNSSWYLTSTRTTNGMTYTATSTIDNNVTVGSAYKRAIANISWTDSDGNNHQVGLSTIVADISTEHGVDNR